VIDSEYYERLAQVPATPVASKQPALKIGAGVTTVAGIFSLVMVIWPNLLNDNQELLVYTIIAILAPIVTALITRNFVWSPYSVAELLKEVRKRAEEAGKNEAASTRAQLIRQKIQERKTEQANLPVSEQEFP
jgi:hypothetical protein